MHRIIRSRWREIYIVITIFFLFSMYNCGGGKTVVYKWNNSLTFLSESMPLSMEKIDKFETRDLYFDISSKEDCIIFGISGSIDSGNISGGTKAVPVYCVIERNVGSISHLEFTEVARNFNADWDNRTNLQICSQDDLPLLRLEKGLYRIRSTIFIKDRYYLNISIQSQNPLIFSSTLP
jgi:hypothetical protein